MVGIEPNATQADTDFPTEFVIAKNLHRRHLSISQRAAIAAEMVPLLREEAHKRQLATLKNQQDTSLLPHGSNERGMAAEIAARTLGVGRNTVERASTVKRHDPALFEKVKSGEITANEAAREVVEARQQAKSGRDSLRAGAHKKREVCEEGF